MTPEAQQRAIAIACGYCVFQGTGRIETRDGTTSEFCIKCGKHSGGKHELPNYLDDLDAMHEAEKMLTDKQWKHYPHFVWEIVHPHDECDSFEGIGRGFLSATAAQRADGFVRTIGQWVEETESQPC